MVGMMWTGGAAPPVLPVSDRRKAGTSVPPRLKGDIDMFTLTRILTLASPGDLAESKADIEMTPLLFAGVRWLPLNFERQVRTGLGITLSVGVAVYGFIHAMNGVSA
jgi:hypothetical protein